MVYYGVIEYDTETFEGILLPIHVGVCGLIIMIMTWYIPTSLGAMIPFYLTFVGRGFVFLFFGGFVMDPSGFTLESTTIGIAIILVAFVYFLISILNLFEIIVIVLPPPILQNDCTQTVSIALAKQKLSSDVEFKKYEKMKDDKSDNDYFDETI